MEISRREECIKRSLIWEWYHMHDTFDASKAVATISEWLLDWERINGTGCNFYVGISGGKDSSVVAAILAYTFGRYRVNGVLMPCGEQADISDSWQLVNHLGIEAKVIDIKPIIDATSASLKEANVEISKQAIINTPPRVRMSILYACSQSDKGRVANTCNLSEDYVGYSTRWGDSVGDFSPLSQYTVGEVKAIGRYLGLPENLIEKVPADGLTNLSDEDNLGFKYVVLDRYIRTGICEDEGAKRKIDYLHSKNAFKLEMMPSCPYYLRHQ